MDGYLTERLGIWCQNEHGKAWIIKKIDAIPIIMSLYETNPLSKTLTLLEFENYFFEALKKRQIIIYYYEKLPAAVFTWAFLSKKDGSDYCKSNNKHPKVWCSGKDLWFINFTHNFTGFIPKWILKHIQSNVFPDHKVGFSKRGRATHKLASKNVKAWHNSFMPKQKTAKRKQTLLKNQATSFRYTHPFRSHDLDINLLAKAKEQLISMHKIIPGARVLVCGTEANEFAMRIAYEYNCEVILYDVKANLLTRSAEIAVSAHKRLEEPEFTIRHGSWNKLPFEDESIDHIFSFGAVARSPTPKQTFLELMRIAKTGSEISLIELAASEKDTKVLLLKKFGISQPLEKHDWHNLIQSFAKCDNLLELQSITKNNWAIPIKSWFHEEQISEDQTKGRQKENDLSSYISFFQRNKNRTNTQTKIKKDERLVTLVTLSGGIDSTYLLWKLLKNTNDEIIALHVDIANNEGRSEIERIRTEQIVLYLSKEVRQFQYETTGIDHTGLNWYGYDMMAIAFEAGIAATSFLHRTNLAVDRWTVASCIEEGGWPKRSVHWNACAEATCYPHRAPPFFAFPTISKAEQMRQMPRELLELTWYCRRPVITRSGYKTCGFCKTCQLVRKLDKEQ